jgi:HlyD family secretion protein
MEVKIRDIRDITNSREVYDAKPKPVASIFIYILLILIVIAIIWMYFGEMDIVIKSNGYVRPNESLSTVKNMIAGEVEQVNFENGQKVNQGDVLYTINHDSLLIQQSSLEDNITTLEEEILLLAKYKESIEENENLFDSETEEEYYNKYKKFNLEYQLTQNDYAYTLDSIEASQMGLILQIDDLKEDNDVLIHLKESIETDIYLEESNEQYNNLYNQYDLKISELETNYEQLQKQYEINLELKDLAVSNYEIEQSRVEAENAKHGIDTYKIAYLEDLRNTIESNETTLESLQQSYDALSIDKEQVLIIGDEEVIKIAALENYRVTEILNAIITIKEYEEQIEQYESQLMQVEADMNDCIVTAKIPGTINASTELTSGDNIFAGTDVLTIIPDDNTQYKVQIYLGNKDIAKLKVGDTVKYHFEALPYDEYGDIPGTITKISTDVIMDENVQSYYLVEATINENTVYDYKGNQTEVKVGMLCEAQIILEQKKILHFVLEKINLFD